MYQVDEVEFVRQSQETLDRLWDAICRDRRPAPESPGGNPGQAEPRSPESGDSVRRD